jgi:hypothetical protein
MKLMVWIGLTVGGALGSWLGSLLDQGNFFGTWGIALSTIGSLVGIWVGYKIAQNYL